jgi:uncharacterized protein YigA (DUF484 family)
MSQKLINEERSDELSWEEAVSRYLEDHPDYFERRPQLLTRLTLNHETGGRAVSLIERQVQVLREQDETSQRQLRELVTIARENDVLGQRLHRFALALIEAPGPDEALEAAVELLRTEFHLEAVAVRLAAEPPLAGTRAEYVAADDARLGALNNQFSAGKPICGGKFDDSLNAFLFGEGHRAIRSSALIPLGAQPARGVLALGSHDPHRFHAGMGTVYLTRLGELLMSALARA